VTIDRELLASRISKIRVELRHLDRLKGMSVQDFLASMVEQHATERELQIVIEACLDIAHHIISREGLRRPTDYRDVFTVLRETGTVEPALAQRLEQMASFRNRLVHGYLQIDPRQIYEIARNELGDVESFLAAIAGRYDAEVA
jgi:uncharacterized protein YutE (UPF0331/DUF86 family)